MAHDIFVSYSSKDKTVTDAIVAALENKKIRCWYAPRDIKPGSDWGEEIAKAISKSKIFLIIFSGNSNRSRRVLDELNLAITKESAILPFRIEKLDPSGAMQLHLSAHHWLDAYDPSWEYHIENLINSVLSNLKNEPEPGNQELEKHTGTSRNTGKNKKWIFLLGGILTALAAFYGISRALTGTHTPALTDPSNPTQEVLASQPAAALGSKENPIIWMYAPRSSLDFNQVSAATDTLLNEFTVYSPDLTLKIMPAPDTATIVKALCEGDAHIGLLGPLSYLSASEKGCAEVKFTWSGIADIKYGGMIITKNDSGISNIADLKGKSFCIPARDSLSGGVLSLLEIQASVGDVNTFLGEIKEVGSHAAVLEMVYMGDCDAGSTYYDARLDSEVGGMLDTVGIILTTAALPNDIISYIKEIDPNISQRLTDFFLNNPDVFGQLLVMSGLTDPKITKIIEINDYYFSEIRNLFQRSGVNPETYLCFGKAACAYW